MSGRTQAAVITTILNTMASKEGEYKQGVQTNHSLTCTAAERLAAHGPLEEAFLTMNRGDQGVGAIIPEEEIQAFFKDQQDRLKALTTKNAEREERIDSFLGAIASVKQIVAEKEDIREGEEDYGKTIKKFMDDDAQQNRQSAILNAKISEIRDRLGEKDPNAGIKDDDDIEVVRNNAETMAKYKCCITAMWMDDPVTSKTCGHSYSREGIMSHIKAKGGQQCQCPFPGCNKTVTEQGKYTLFNTLPIDNFLIDANFSFLYQKFWRKTPDCNERSIDSSAEWKRRKSTRKRRQPWIWTKMRKISSYA
jgi:Zinc-finger of the MIZ type in Nse subunit